MPLFHGLHIHRGGHTAEGSAGDAAPTVLGALTMEAAQRLALHLALALLALGSAIVSAAAAAAPSAGAEPIRPAAVATFYGADSARMNTAIGSIWPQYNGAFCGLVAAEAAVNYDDEVHGVPLRFSGRGAQSAVAAANQHSGASRWGFATPTNAFAGITNIAPDFGADPRSIAYMTYNYTPNNVFFHDYIYRWQFANGSQPSFFTQAEQAATNVARSLETWHEPVDVTINGGLHSVMVTGVFSFTNPATSYPAQIASVVYRDPESSPSASRFQVDFSTWQGGGFATPFGVYSLWSLYYGDRSRRGDGLNRNDPEPTVGPYRPSSSNPVHWFRGFTWIARDTNFANGTFSPDFAFRSTGQLMTAP